MQRRGLVILGMQQGMVGAGSPLRDGPSNLDDAVSATIQLMDHESWSLAAHVSMVLNEDNQAHFTEAEASLAAVGLVHADDPASALDASILRAQRNCLYLQANPGRDAFRGSRLDQVLTDHHIGQVVMIGPTIGGMLDATCRTAYSLGYEVLVPSDCLVASSPQELQVYVETVLGAYVRVVTSGDLMGVDS